LEGGSRDSALLRLTPFGAILMCWLGQDHETGRETIIGVTEEEAEAALASFACEGAIGG
jgi:hypothetical protein